ncbi:type IV toxin-antitoxin system AbiEi family antitoxin domain-containing protein [Demequina litorisediminis]|uniref:type IV toxin-antitoxin system AbiEi family antitoxin domain-containing protein n=1 Tax=Demequina litorisediminis TaxID=1849022 RepID=UPI0024E105BB|nr:type IV toxin-antitoxin system AbiEi family antitoxin domain-containing protein [Demequina litorisediminis]
MIERIVRDVEAYGRPVRRAEITAMCHPRTLDRAVARGSLTRLAPGLYASTSTARLPSMRIAAAAAWMPSRAHIAGGAALHLWGIEGHLGETVSIGSAPPDSGPAPRGMRLWRSRALVRTDMVGGIRTASVADAFIQWWCLRARPLTEGPALDILRDGGVNARHAQAALARHPRVPSRALLTRLLHEFADGVHSALEPSGAA